MSQRFVRVVGQLLSRTQHGVLDTETNEVALFDASSGYHAIAAMNSDPRYRNIFIWTPASRFTEMAVADG